MSNQQSQKIIFLGDSSIGKTSLIEKYIIGCTTDVYNCTIGVDFHKKSVTHNNININLQIWDTAGQEKFRSLVSTYFRNSTIAVIVFSLNSIESFNNIKIWYDTLRRYSTCPVYLVGNKKDIHNPVITKEMINHIKQNIDFINYYETSIYQEKGIENLMQDITEYISKHIINQIENNTLQGKKIKNNKKKKSVYLTENCCIIS